MKEAEKAIKNNMTVMAESNVVLEASDTSQGNAQQNLPKSTSGRKSTMATGTSLLHRYLALFSFILVYSEV